MCTDQNIDLSVLQFLEGLGEFFAGLEAVDVIHGDRKITQPSREAAVVLHGQNGGRYEDGYLLSVGRGFEGSTDGHLGFSKAHIATHEAVHWGGALHVFFDGMDGCSLIWRLLKHEAGLEFVEHVIVRRKRKSC